MIINGIDIEIGISIHIIDMNDIIIRIIIISSSSSSSSSSITIINIFCCGRRSGERCAHACVCVCVGGWVPTEG